MYLVVTNLKSLLLYTTPLGFLKIEVELIYNVALVFAVQQSDSAYIYIYICISIYIHILLLFFSAMVCHRMLTTAACAIQQDPVVHPFCM